MAERLQRRMDRGVLVSQASKILIIALQGLGNALLLMPFLHVLKVGLPQSKMSILVLNNGSEEVVQGNPDVDEIIVLDRNNLTVGSTLRLLRSLRSRQFELAVVAWPGGLRSSLLALLSGAKIRVGYEGGFAVEICGKIVYTHQIGIGEPRHDLERNLELASAIGIDIGHASRQMILPIGRQEREYGKSFLKQKGISDSDILIGIQPGSNPSQAWKRWPKERFVELAWRLSKELGARIMLFGLPHETDILTYIGEQLSPKPIIVDDLSLKKVAALIECCAAFISNDSGLMHVAVCVNVPTVAIMGPTDYRRTAPYGPLHRVIRREEISCQPRYRFGDQRLRCSLCKLRRIPLCLEVITVEEVMLTVQDVLNHSLRDNQKSTRVSTQMS